MEEKPTLVDNTHSTIKISWKKPTVCTKQYPVPTQDVTKYQVFTRKPRDELVANLSASALTYTLEGCSPHTLYEIEVIGWNRNGEGKEAPTIEVKTDEHSMLLISFFILFD